MPTYSRDSVQRLTAEFTARLRNGETPSIDEYTARHPELADDLRHVLTGIVENNAASTTGTLAYSKYLSHDAGLPSRESDLADQDSLTKIGRYRIVRLLGAGGFGRVYLSHDEQLGRQVAIKIPHAAVRSRIGSDEYLREAQIVASLDHPGIVPVYDVGRTDEGSVFIVSRFVEGRCLADTLPDDRPDFIKSASIVLQVATALEYAHSRGLVHRDIKPANILLDRNGTAFITDFGIALRDHDPLDSIHLAGTPQYMSPEQARGESHLIDGRSDIFSLGIVLYELLTGTTPFRGPTPHDIMRRITNSEARPPRQFNKEIPSQLERVCLKALAHRAADRYPTAHDFASDLEVFLQQAIHKRNETAPGASRATPSDSVKSLAGPIVPKGLLSFDQHDADFFLQLLPGPYDRTGLPECIRFWKHRIEDPHPNSTFRVGVIYGPSGCGKSSLLRAGIVPRLDSLIDSIVIDATSHDFGHKLLKALLQRWPELTERSTLADAISALRRLGSPGHQKRLIAIDQFEQFLQAASTDELRLLAEALRHCDGVSVQCLLLARVDFWLGLSRFFQQLEPPALDGSNSRLVDLFELTHARNVLVKFGRAYQALPLASDLSSSHQAFLDQAIEQMQEDGKVIAVRLSVFADMMKGKMWEPATLKQFGGVEGIGMRFLEESLGQRSANPEHRRHQSACRAVLAALMPDQASDLKGAIRSRQELLDVSGYRDRPADFQTLLNILDTELRLITPVTGLDEPPSVEAGSRYQLTHDYLVRSLREWLWLKQKETRRGRAQLLLAEHSALWKKRPRREMLPRLWPYLRIRTLVSPRTWTVDESRMMRAAARRQIGRCGVILAVSLIACLSAWFVHDRYETKRVDDMVAALFSAETNQIPRWIEQLRPYSLQAHPRLLEASRGKNPSKKLRARLVLLESDSNWVKSVIEDLLNASSADEFEIVRDAMREHTSEALPELRRVWSDPRHNKPLRFRAACAILSLGENSLRELEPFAEQAEFLTRQLVEHAAEDGSYDTWLQSVKPIRKSLIARVAAIANEQSQHSYLAAKIASRLAEEPESLVQLLLQAHRNHLAVFLSRLEACGERAKVLRSLREVAESPENARRLAIARLALLKLGAAEEAWSVLSVGSDPSARSYFISYLPEFKIDAGSILNRLNLESDPGRLRGLILAIASLGEEVTDSMKATWSPKLLQWYRDHPDAGVHGAVEYLLRNWGHSARLTEIVPELAGRPGRNEPGSWFVNSQGQTFAVVRAGSFQLGSSRTIDPHASEREELIQRSINRTFAIATKTVTHREFALFQKARGEIDGTTHIRPADLELPKVRVKWFDAARYCNWLSEQEGIDPDQWCYRPNANGQYESGTSTAENCLHLTGYRLPTEAEWEYACRCGRPAIMNRYYGSDDELLHEYAWHGGRTSVSISGLLKPNDLGLFDMHGNVWQWCLNQYVREKTTDDQAPGEVKKESEMMLRGGSFEESARFIRTARNYYCSQDRRFANFGFRIARTISIENTDDNKLSSRPSP